MVESRLDVILNFIKKGTGAQAASKELTNLEKSTKGATDETKGFNLAQTAAKLGIAAVTVAAIKQIPQMAQLGFRYENAQIALAAYAGSAKAATAVTESIIDASGGAISKFDAVTNATRLLSLGLATNADEAARFTKTAVTLGATMGKDVQGAFEEFSLLLANQSILRLDTYGISGAKVREEMARLAAEFPELDRNTRFVNATMTIAADKMGKLEEAGFQATSSLDVMSAGFENLKLSAATFVADGVIPVTDGIVGTSNAAFDANKRLAEGADSFAEYEKAAKLANTSLGGDVIGRLALSTNKLSEAQFNSVKSTQAMAEANEELVIVEEEVILTQGGINELLQEQTFLSKALALGMGGSLTKATDKYQESVEKLKEDARELATEFDENALAISELTTAFEANFAPTQEYLVSVEALSIKQSKLNTRLKEGKISQREYNNETDKIVSAHSKLDGALGDSDTAFNEYNDTLGELTDRQDEITDQLNELGDVYETLGDENNELTQALKRTTAELIFQAAAADLDAQTSLLLARELGLVDEATFAVAQNAQALRIQYDEGAISSGEFATQAGILADNVGNLQSKNIEITVDTLAAEGSISALEQALLNIGQQIDITNLLSGNIASDLPVVTQPTGKILGSFQDGADFMIPDVGPMGDRHQVSMNLERGERVQVTPRGGGGPGGGVSIGQVILGSSLDLAFFKNTLERIR